MSADDALRKCPVIAVRPKRQCELCGKTAECQPYGPQGEQVCFSCGMKDEKAAERRFSEILRAQEQEGGEA